MSNPNAPGFSTFELPSLTSTDFHLLRTNIILTGAPPGMQHPRLTLTGEEGTFEHAYAGGNLVVYENSTAAPDITVTRSADSLDNDAPRGNSSVGNTIRSSGHMPLAVAGEALLQIPKNHRIAEHKISTIFGDTKLEAVEAERLQVATVLGRIASYDARVDEASFKTTTGNIRCANLISTGRITANTTTGNIVIADGDAPSWGVETVSGRIIVRDTLGVVRASSAFGEVTAR